MATSVTATATMAAAGMEKRSSVALSSASSLNTPRSAGYPSELRSPMVGSPGFIRREEALRTPITPPSAYMDFLKTYQHSPALLSPAPTSTSARFSFEQKPSSFASDASTGEKPSISPPTSQPAFSRTASYDSNASSTSTASDATRSTVSNVSASSRTRPESPRIAIPPTPSFAKPGPPSAGRTPKRLYIPQSPAFSPALASATQSVNSPYVSTPLSAAPWSASFSPREPGPKTKVSVRQVVTRTVTYCSTPLEPAPKGKRRKVEEAVKDDSEDDHDDGHRRQVEPANESPPFKREGSVDDTTTAVVATTPLADQRVKSISDATVNT